MVKSIQVITKHPNIGYSNNVAIIETALREEFGIDDQSYILKAIAAHIWGVICGSTTNNEHKWGTEEVIWAVAQCQSRLNKIMDQFKCTREGCAISYPHIKHE